MGGCASTQENPGMAQPLENLGKPYMPIGYYRIDLPAIEVDTLYEFDTVHFINVTKKLEIESCPYMVAQLHHGEVVHVYGAGEDNASFFNEEGSEVAPLATLSNGRRRVHVRLPYFGTTDEIDGWMTVGSWMVPMKMYRDRPFQPLTSDFRVDPLGCASFSWDWDNGPFTIEHRLNTGSSLNSEVMIPTMAPSAFQFTSALGYLDVARLVIPRHPRHFQPRGTEGYYDFVGDLEELLLRNGGAWWQHRSRELPGYEQRLSEVRAMHLSRSITIINLAISERVTDLALQQRDLTLWNDGLNDDPQHLE
jgi:hypothetical protein